MSIKVFDLIPVLQRLDQVKAAQIECFHYSNTILCIGTSDGHILRYSINKSNYLGENVGFKSDFVDYKLVSQRRQPINLITIIPDLQKILFLSDGLLNVNNFHDLEPSQSSTLRLKNVTTYCYSEKYDERLSPFGADISILCVCIKSRNLQIYTIENNEVNLFKEIVLPSLCLRVEINKNYICVASDNSYLIANILNSTVQTLFSYDIESFSPFITNSIEGEFLLNCQGDLGMFASFDGQTTRPPVPWCQNCTKFQIFNPYVLCVSNDESIKVFNLTDLKLKQEISLGGMVVKHLKYVSEDKFLFVSTPSQIFILTRTSMLFQVEQLLIKKQVDEAITLFDCLSINLSKTDYEEQMQKIKIKSAFIELIENKNYSKSEQLFLEASMDYKQVDLEILVTLFPGYTVSVTAPEKADELIDKYKAYFTDNKLTLTDLQSIKSLAVNLMLKSKKLFKDEEFVSVLLKLCIETDQKSLNQIEFFSNLPVNFCLQNIQALNESKRFHSVAIIYYLVDQYENAFEIWRNICDGKIVDSNFPGFEFVIEQLAVCKDHQLVWKYVDWSMQIDQVKAVEIFTKRSNEELASERMRVDVILECLQNYRDALTIYLEYLIYTKNIKKEKLNTQLVNIYLENITELLKAPEENQNTPEWNEKLNSARVKFQNIIESPINFRVNTILVKVKEYEANLQKECAILYGRIEEHEKALKILVYTLGDYTAAINYCLNNSRDSVKSRKQLFNILFSIYTNPNYTEKDKLIKPALELLNSKLITNFDLPRLLDMIPNNWSMKLTGEFLQSALNTNLAKKRNLLAEKNIALNYKFTLQTMLFNLKQEQLYVSDDSECFKCHKSLDSTLFVRYPNGKLSHKICKSEIKSKRLDF